MDAAWCRQNNFYRATLLLYSPLTQIRIIRSKPLSPYILLQNLLHKSIFVGDRNETVQLHMQATGKLLTN